MAWLGTLCLYFAILTSAAPIFAQEASSKSEETLLQILLKPTLSDADRIEIFRRGQDSRRALLKDLFPIWTEGRDSLVRARAGWLIGRFWDDDAKDDPKWDFQAVMKGAIALIEEQSLPVPKPALQFYELDYQVIRKQSELSDVKEKMLDLAHRIADPKEKAYALSQLIVYFSQRGLDKRELPALLNEVHQLLGTRYESFSLVDVDTLNNISIALQEIGQYTDAQVTEKILDSACDSQQMRGFCLTRAYNAGFYLTGDDAPGSAAKAIALFLRSLDLSQQVHDQRHIGSAYYGLSLAYNQSGEYQKAIQYGLKAVDIFAELDNKLWGAIAWKALSTSYLDDHRPELALTAAQKSLQLCPKEFKGIESTIHKQLSNVYLALKRYEEAFHSLNLYLKSEKHASAEDANKKYMELRHQALSKQNEWQAEQINLLKNFRLVSMLAAGLALVVCLVLLIVWRQASAIRLSRQKMKEVLDHIDEGIVVLDRQLRIKSGYSPYLDKIFSREPGTLQNAPLLDLLFPLSGSEYHPGVLVRETLSSCLGEKALSWEFNQTHLPHECMHQGMILGLHWQPLFNAQELISSILVSIRDMTELRTMEKKMEQESKRVSLLQNKLEEILAGKSQLIRQLFGELKETRSELQMQVFQPDQQTQVMRRLHTWKGVARSLGLKHLAGSIHELESCLVPAAAMTRTALEEKWNAFSLTFQDYEHLLNTILVSQRPEESETPDLYAYARLYSDEMKLRLDQVNCSQQGVMVLDHVKLWKPKVLPLIHEMLLHAVSNAVDHGFIRPIQEGKTVAPALIQIQAMTLDQKIVLQVLDNGAGIPWDRLRKKAEENNFVPQPGQSYADLLFLDGISTAASTSATSGRGVGLSAIRGTCLQLGGAISIADAEGGGTALRMEFPLPSLCETIT